MQETEQGQELQGQPGQPRPGAVNPASAQGGQGESQPGMTQVDTTKTAGSTATQMDQHGRALGVGGHLGERDDARASGDEVELRDGGDTKPSESQP